MSPGMMEREELLEAVERVLIDPESHTALEVALAAEIKRMRDALESISHHSETSGAISDALHGTDDI
jgi:DNA-binding transcriptional regulator/RsmH inhibitor MraZ